MLLSTSNNWSNPLSSIGQFFFLIVVFVFVIFLAYYFTKWLAGANRGIRGNNSNFKIVDGIAVGYQSHVQLLKVGDKYILIGVTKDKITYLTEIPAEDIVLNTDGTVPKIPFEKYLGKFLK